MTIPDAIVTPSLAVPPCVSTDHIDSESAGCLPTSQGRLWFSCGSMMMEWTPPDALTLPEAIALLKDSDAASEPSSTLRAALARDELVAFIIDRGTGEECDIPAALWRTAEAETAFRLGRMTWQAGPTFLDAVEGQVLFDRDDLHAWLSPPRTEFSEDASDAQERAYQWWVEKATALRADGKWIKMAAYLAECRTKAACTDREAKRAFSTLPPDLKRKSGQRDVSSS